MKKLRLILKFTVGLPVYIALIVGMSIIAFFEWIFGITNSIGWNGVIELNELYWFGKDK